MRLFAAKLLADENIHPQVLKALRQLGCDLEDVFALGLGGQPDEVVLDKALKDGRILLTHDRDFGRLAIVQRKPLRGIAFLRPGHISPQFTLDTLNVIQAQDIDLSPSFILVARRRGSQVQLRLRRW